MRMSAPVLTVLLLLSVQAAVPAARQAAGAGAQQPATPAAQEPAPQEPAQPAPAEGQQPPRIRTGINYVRVDVIVTDKKGQPVLDLAPEDFSISEDGKPQKIEAFDIVKIDSTATEIASGPPRAIQNDFDEEREASRPDVRLFVILLDDYHVRRGNDMSVRKPLIDFIENQLAPADMVAIMYPLTPITDLRFSRDRASAVSAIEKFEGRKFNYTPRNMFEEQYANYPASVVERVRNEVTMGALKGAAVKMAGLREGRKSIVFVSEGFTAMLPTQMQDPVASQPGYGNPYKGDAGAPQASATQNLIAKADLLSDMQQVFSTLNRQNTSIYAVDPRGLAAFEYDINEVVGLQQDAIGLRASLDTLQELAVNTDGRAIINRNDLAIGMKQILRDSSAYYLLGYNSTQTRSDGKFHEIKVRVKRSGVDVRHRKGYWALTPDETARAIAPPKPIVAKDVDAALGALQTAPRGQYISSWVGLSRGNNGKTKVTFIWEPAANMRARGELPAQVHLTVVGADGAPYFRGATPESASANPAARGPQRLTFEVPPGRIQVKYAIRDATEATLDTDIREFSIPDLAAPQVGLSTPGVLRARTSAEAQTILKDPNAVPVVAREFRRTERLIVRTQAYGPGTEIPAVTAKLLNRVGTSMLDLPITLDQATGMAQVDLPLSGIAPGEYLLDIRATGQGGEAKQLVAFKVVS
jgi:VWFA-related protein